MAHLVYSLIQGTGEMISSAMYKSTLLSCSPYPSFYSSMEQWRFWISIAWHIGFSFWAKSSLSLFLDTFPLRTVSWADSPLTWIQAGLLEKHKVQVWGFTFLWSMVGSVTSSLHHLCKSIILSESQCICIWNGDNNIAFFRVIVR